MNINVDVNINNGIKSKSRIKHFVYINMFLNVDPLCVDKDHAVFNCAK